MRRVVCAFVLLALGACDSETQSRAAENTASSKVPSARAIYEVQVQTQSVSADFRMNEPGSDERAAEVARLEEQFRPYAGGDTVHATYRFLKSGDLALVERAAYIGSSPAYAQYLGLKDGQLVSIVCVANSPLPGAIVTYSNCADAVGKELGFDYQAMITGGGTGA